jgi:hypothetical protein
VGYDYKFFFPIYQCLIFFDLPFAKIDEEAWAHHLQEWNIGI